MQCSWASCPTSVRRQVNRVVTLLHRLSALSQMQLEGVYLHGSLAMGCFNPDRSDIDILAVTRERLTIEAQQQLATAMLTLSKSPSPIEISVQHLTQLRPWRYPPPFDFHFGESWRGRYETELAGRRCRGECDEVRTDIDLAAHITVVRARGVALYGPPASELFPPVPPQDYLAAIVDDVRWAFAEPDRDPGYAILNVCRVYRYLVTGEVCSKDEGGTWAMSVVPREYRALVAQALGEYRGKVAGSLDRTAMAALLEYLEAHIDRIDKPGV